MIESIGWIGSLLLGICAVPEAIHSLRIKKCRVPDSLLFLWFFGEILCLIYTFIKLGFNPLIINYLINILCLSTITYWRFNVSNNNK